MYNLKSEKCEIKINFKHDLYSNCIQDIFITYLQWKNYDYRKVFDHTWSFGMKRTEWGIDLYRTGFNQLFASLSYNFGIYLEFYDCFKDSSRFLDIINQELQEGRMVGLEIDPFYCEWHRIYKKYHGSHFVLLTGLSSDGLICIDPYISKTPERISFELFFQGASRFFLISEEISGKYDWKDNMNKNLRDLFAGSHGLSDFEQMRKFSDDIDEAHIRFEVEKYDSLVFYPMLLRLNNVADGRRCYSRYLDYLMTIQQDIDFPKYFEPLIKASRLWSETSALMLKYILSNYNEMLEKKLKDKIMYISETEEAIAHELICELRS
ncbi:BtrH N-terminal domain-containing protein [Paenibacillus etheri]|uniref:Uncharacterized protein n=1 Tax=Paenibacillus etheri TaxID=1306852 RepID=A0A0W1AZ96_9BACL|nr:BtrH N-terminal domain-containing protein [Paenibacillus etheri]KTD86650.1 hypothetical protein UQ64_14430 [Paenibacillus etheri]